ncbi:MAG: hypothetical protein ACE5PO_07070, partial [Candidatus Bathyarchaeia archaeon]
YWVRELRRTVKREWTFMPKRPQLRDEWDYELVESGGTFTLVAEVPGPASLVEAKVDGRILQIHGGNSFRKRVKLPTNLRIQAASYVNGVLNLRLLRAEKNSVILDEAESYDTP